MDLKDLRYIVDLIKRNGLTQFEIEKEGLKLKIARESLLSAGPVMPPHLVAAAHPHFLPTHTPQPVGPTLKEIPDAVLAVDVMEIKSPMVGTFYPASSPESTPFVRVGDKVGPKTVVCIIEAMKVMNEIQAQEEGIVSEILLKAGQPVEYGQPLFRLRKA